MEFHPKKCQALHVTNKRNIIKASYNIHGHILEETDSAKYLGVNIHHKLSWNHHIQKVTSKANSTRAFLQRNIHPVSSGNQGAVLQDPSKTSY